MNMKMDIRIYMDMAEMHIDIKELGYPKSDIGTKFNQKSYST